MIMQVGTELFLQDMSQAPYMSLHPHFYHCSSGHLDLWSACAMLGHVQLFATPWSVAPPGSSDHGIILQTILEWVAISYSRGSS